jgi:hypothetical protein
VTKRKGRGSRPDVSCKFWLNQGPLELGVRQKAENARVASCSSSPTWAKGVNTGDKYGGLHGRLISGRNRRAFGRYARCFLGAVGGLLVR